MEIYKIDKVITQNYGHIFVPTGYGQAIEMFSDHDWNQIFLPKF